MEIHAAETAFVDKAVKDGKPFLLWFNTTRIPRERLRSAAWTRCSALPDTLSSKAIRDTL